MSTGTDQTALLCSDTVIDFPETGWKHLEGGGGGGGLLTQLFLHDVVSVSVLCLHRCEDQNPPEPDWTLSPASSLVVNLDRRQN